jgi:hypothetical protein
MLCDPDVETANDLRWRGDDPFGMRLAVIVRLLEFLRKDWPEVQRLVDEVIACELVLEADEPTAAPRRRQIGAQAELDKLNARLWDLTRHRV